jgi:hypothetical protein
MNEGVASIEVACPRGSLVKLPFSDGPVEVTIPRRLPRREGRYRALKIGSGRRRPVGPAPSFDDDASRQRATSLLLRRARAEDLRASVDLARRVRLDFASPRCDA